MTRPLRHGLRWLAWAGVAVAVRITVKGRAPAHGAVLASNHPSYLDGVLGVWVERCRTRPVVKPQRHLAARAAFWLSDAIPVGEATRAEAAAHLRAGGLVWLGPEGHMTGPVLGPGHPGAAAMAAAAGVPIVPLAVHCTARLRLRDWRPWRRPPVRLEFGAPVASDADGAVVMDEVMRTFSAMTGVPYDPS